MTGDGGDDKTKGAAVTPPAGKTEIDDKITLEAGILAIAAARRIADEIAVRAGKAIGREPALVILGNETLAARIADWRAVSARIGVLEEAGESLLSSERGLVRSLESRKLAGLAGVSAGVEALAHFLSFFKADIAYEGRDIPISEADLYPVIAGGLVRAGIDRVILGGAPVSGGPVAHRWDLVGRVELLLGLRSRLQPLDVDAAGQAEGDPAPDTSRQRANAVIAEIDRLVDEFKVAGENAARLAHLQEASEIAHLIDGSERAFHLTVKVVRSGGHYRRKRHLWTVLFEGDRLSYNGGAAVSFVLNDLKTARVADGDLLYHASGHVAFPEGVVAAVPSNLTAGGRAAGAEAARPAAASLAATESASLREEPATPNAGDDEGAEAEEEERNLAPAGGLEGAGPWRLAESLKVLRQQVDAIAPGRSRISDGGIGDQAHQSRNSDHNPWVRDGAVGVVTAFDITDDPRNGCSAGQIAEAILRSRDFRIKYIIWNRRIAYSRGVGEAAPWTWLRYGGDNPHTRHVHISVKSEKAAYDSRRAWDI
ncbi:MAG: hypothetical protein ACOYJQ_08325 [Pseudochelatococcus sp.]|uniref:hypothetical protein n=1 Tax=Pseudochelatococcus sp. TaxID=2020869 RepID=UPI003D8A6B42